jgi:hypothetical protein
MLKVLHGSGSKEKIIAPERPRADDLDTIAPPPDTQEETSLLKDGDAEDQAANQQDWRSKMRLLIGAFVVSGVYVRAPRFLNAKVTLMTVDTILLLCSSGP